MKTDSVNNARWSLIDNKSEPSYIALSTIKLPGSGSFNQTLKAGSDYEYQTHFSDKVLIKYWFETDNADNFDFDIIIGGIVYDMTLNASSTGWVTLEYDVPLSLQDKDGWVEFYSDSPNKNAIVYLDFKLAKPVPEPTTMLLLGFGIIGVAGIRRYCKS